MSCSECNGAGYVVKLDVMNAKRKKEMCPKCLGIPETKKLNPDGIRHCALPYKPYIWQEFRDDKPIATLLLMLCMVMNGRAPELVKDNPLAPTRPRIYAKIWDMNTKPKHRKQGIMDRLLMCAMQDTRIEWFETSWSDSTEDGRQFLLNRGFKREEDRLIFAKPEELGKN